MDLLSDQVERLRRTDTIVNAVANLRDAHGMRDDEALAMMVVELAKDRAERISAAVDAAMRGPSTVVVQRTKCEGCTALAAANERAERAEREVSKRDMEHEATLEQWRSAERDLTAARALLREVAYGGRTMADVCGPLRARIEAHLEGR